MPAWGSRQWAGSAGLGFMAPEVDPFVGQLETDAPHVARLAATTSTVSSCNPTA
jgi:hypothetical protein